MIFQLKHHQVILYGKLLKKQGDKLQSSNGTDGGTYHWINRYGTMSFCVRVYVNVKGNRLWNKLVFQTN